MKGQTRNHRPATRYRLFLGAIGVAFIYLFSTEVFDRWSQTAGRYREVLGRESVAVAPESLAAHRRLLRAEAESLRAELDRASGAYSRTLAGFLSLISTTARAQNVKLLNVAPVRNDEPANEDELRFKVDCQGEFHQIALVLNTLENSPLDIHIMKVELSLGESPARHLESSIEGRFKKRDGSEPSPLVPSRRAARESRLRRRRRTDPAPSPLRMGEEE